MPQRQLRLGAFIMATGHHVAAWRHPGSQVDSGINIDHYIEVAQTAERGLFDQVFVADSPGLWHKGDDESLSRQGRVSHFEPVTLWAALSAVTKHIGFVATASTTYEDPYLLARKFASLDHLSKGRAAWNVVTTGGRQRARQLRPRRASRPGPALRARARVRRRGQGPVGQLRGRRLRARRRAPACTSIRTSCTR